MVLFYILYLTILFCLYSVLYVTQGLKAMLLIFGAVHFGSALLLLVGCGGELWADVSAWKKQQAVRRASA